MDTPRQKRLRKLIAEMFDGSQTGLATRCGMSLAQLGQYLSGYRNIGEKVARKIEAACGLATGWLDADDLPAVAVQRAISVPVPQYDLRLAAGNGHMQWEVIEGEPYSFPMSVFTRSKVDPAHAKIVQVQGDSMSPWVDDGWVVMLDTSPQQRIIDGQPYAIAWDGEYYLKRVTRIPGGALQLTSDNPAYAPVIIPATEAPNVQVLGRVFWRGG